ncbi:DUF2934 domain-containing protein [Shinella curvata]|uniref:DUF2934 domain-containing protein n=1 Tax=Shinella curvata TaxID=1817964 RepID=A0ABT8XKN2_9HYPH|nr:DUF2934 domain-containing protein [Shinella curvata]MCJ8056918.1 DUF2934 domain-containing protein [Shinella curvata]MDO6124253.1 DUF2934 domain-containing protein [Shinella curvata]
MHDPRERRITARAFELWQNESCLDGRSLGHWLEAEKQIDDELTVEAAILDQAESSKGGSMDRETFEAFDDAGIEALIYATASHNPSASAGEWRYFLDGINGPELYMHGDKRLREFRPGEGEGEGARRAWTLRR